LGFKVLQLAHFLTMAVKRFYLACPTSQLLPIASRIFKNGQILRLGMRVMLMPICHETPTSRR